MSLDEADDKNNNLQCLLRLNDYDQELIVEELKDLKFKHSIQVSEYELSLLPLKQQIQQLKHERLKLVQELNSLCQAHGWTRSARVETLKREVIEQREK